MRLSVNLDKLERRLTRFTEGRADGRLGRLMFPPSQTPLTTSVSMRAVIRRSLVFPLFIIAHFVVFFGLMITAGAVLILIHLRSYVHHIPHRIPWLLMKLLYSIALKAEIAIVSKHGGPMQYLFITVDFAVLNFALLLALRWAWNRRAARLNCEASLPQQALVVDGGVWPPQPNVPDEEQVSRLDSHHAASCRHGQDGEGTY